MKNSLLCAFAMLFVVALSAPGCKKLIACDCETWENCLAGDCMVKENVYFLGETGIELEGENFYVGIMQGEVCPDTIVVDLIEEYYMKLYVKELRDSGRYEAKNIAPVFIRRYDTFAIDSSYGASCQGQLCPDWHVSLEYQVFPDSINMTLYLIPVFGTAEDKLNYVTLHKK